MLNGDGKKMESRLKDLISKKTNCTCSTLFSNQQKKKIAHAARFLSFFAVVLHNYNVVLQDKNVKLPGYTLFLAKQGGERRAARYIISSRASRACIAQASQGKRDFLLAINLSSLVGVRLDVIQSSDVKAHYGFRGNRLPSTTKLWVLFMKTGFFICEL